MDTGMDADTADGRWLTYAELAKARGIDKQSAVKLAFRHRWRRQKDNRGTVRAYVPAEWAEPPGAKPDTSRDMSMDASTDMSIVIKPLENANTALQERARMADARADRAEQRADRAEQRAVTDRERADQADADRRAADARADGSTARTEAERERADRAEQGRDAERVRADALRDRLDELLTAYDQARTETEAEKQARREAEAALQAWQDRSAADDTARRSLGLVARLLAVWRGSEAMTKLKPEWEAELERLGVRAFAFCFRRPSGPQMTQFNYGLERSTIRRVTTSRIG